MLFSEHKAGKFSAGVFLREVFPFFPSDSKIIFENLKTPRDGEKPRSRRLICLPLT